MAPDTAEDPYNLLEKLVLAWDTGFPPSDELRSERYVSTMFLLCDLGRIVRQAREIVDAHRKTEF